MATQSDKASDKAKRAAAKKAIKQRQQEADDQELIESTCQPRQAKTKALETAVWNMTSHKRAASPEAQLKERAPKKSKAVKPSVPQENHPGKADSKKQHKLANTVAVNENQTKTLKKTVLKRIPAAPIEDSGSEQDEGPVLPPKFRAKGKNLNIIKTPHVKLVKSVTDTLSDEYAAQESDSNDLSAKSHNSESNSSGDDLMNIEGKDLSKIFSDEQPAILEPEPEENSASLFDNDDNVEIVVQDNDTDMVPRTEISSRRSSSHYSVPPTTDSDRDVAMPGADKDSDEPGPEAIHANLQSNHRQQSSKLNSSTQSGVRRQKAFLAEKPNIRKTGNEKKEKSSKLASTSTSLNIEWPQHASLVLPSTGKSLLLNSQHVYVAHVVRHAILKLSEETLLVDAFLDVDKKINYHRRLLIEAACKLKSGIPQIGDMYDRLEEDTDFSDALGKLVTDRLSVIRVPVKTHALVEIAAYELGKGDRCVERVEALFNRLVFIFPGSWTIDNKTNKEQWKFKSNKPFLNSAIGDVIRLSFFNSPRGTGYQLIKKCVSTLDGHDEPELPMGLVALACTGIYAALDEWKTGSKVTAKFEGNVFAAIYKAIYKNLEGIKTQNPKAYHVIMAELYTLAVTKPTAPSEEDTLQIMDLTGF